MSSNSSNLELWNAVTKTDINACKKNTEGGRTSTSINAYYMIKAATEQWGPLGVEWRYEIREERYDEGPPIMSKPDNNGVQVELAKHVTHTIMLDLWSPGAKHPATQYGHTRYIYPSKYGFTVDTEAPKKSLTDAIKKCLSLYGFSFDVFSGEMDNPEYVDSLIREDKINKIESVEDKQVAAENEYVAWRQKHCEFIETAQSLNELEKLFTIAIRRVKSHAASFSGEAAKKQMDIDIKMFISKKDQSKQRLENQ